MIDYNLRVVFGTKPAAKPQPENTNVHSEKREHAVPHVMIVKFQLKDEEEEKMELYLTGSICAQDNEH